MENAAFGVTKALSESGCCDGRALVVCGTGSNGGDGLAVLRQRIASGGKGDALLIGSPDELGGDARPVETLEKAGVIVRPVEKPGDLEAAAGAFSTKPAASWTLCSAPAFRVPWRACTGRRSR